MGCSASALGVDMAQNLLKIHKNSNAVILSTEILSNGWYSGKDRSMMVLNCLFRSGSAAILISNKASAKRVSKYKLLYALRTQGAFDDVAYKSAIREEDDKGIIGVTLKKDVLHVAGELLRTNFQTLGSSILPLEEKIKYGFSIIRKKFLNNSRELYVPNFRKVIQHYCLPTSGKTVITEIGKKMKLKEDEVEPALMTLHRFGNQSSSSLWYELASMEGKERDKQGERVLQLEVWEMKELMLVLALQHLPLSPATFLGYPGRHVAGDTHPGRHDARDNLKGKARQGFFPVDSFPGDFPERLGGTHKFSVKLICAMVDTYPGRHVARESGVIKK
ncbi:3-ketoacyl-CoA synthase 5-like protein [Tanacetum coccineum]